MMSMRTVVTKASDDSWECDVNENRSDHSFRWQLREWCQWEPLWPKLLMTAESVMSMRTVVTTASDDSWEYDINENRCDHSFWWQLRVWCQWEPLWPKLLMKAESIMSMRTVVTTASNDSWQSDDNEKRCYHIWTGSSSAATQVGNTPYVCLEPSSIFVLCVCDKWSLRRVCAARTFKRSHAL